MVPLQERLVNYFIIVFILISLGYFGPKMRMNEKRLNNFEKINKEEVSHIVDSVVAANINTILLEHSLKDMRGDIEILKYQVYDQKILWQTVYDFMVPDELKTIDCEEPMIDTVYRDLTDSMVLAAAGIKQKKYDEIYNIVMYGDTLYD